MGKWEGRILPGKCSLTFFVCLYVERQYKKFSTMMLRGGGVFNILVPEEERATVGNPYGRRRLGGSRKAAIRLFASLRESGHTALRFAPRSRKMIEAAVYRRRGGAGEPQNRGTEERRNRGTEEQRNRGTEEQRNRVTEEQRNKGTGEQKNRGTEEPQNRRTEERGNRRTEEQKNRGTEEVG